MPSVNELGRITHAILFIDYAAFYFFVFLFLVFFFVPARLQVAVMFSLEYFGKRGIDINTPVNALLVRASHRPETVHNPNQSTLGQCLGLIPTVHSVQMR